MDRPTSDLRSRLFALEQIGIKLGLDQIRGLVEALTRPDRAFSSIVIAGTNGKGSVTAMVERGLREAGYRTGRYTSPHLVHLEERFALDGTDVAPDVLDASLARVFDAATALPAPPSFFEATTAAALDLFREAAVDIAVLEVGLGGRLDATNIVVPVAVAITAVDFDHQEYLGHTLPEIAGEKAGVIKSAIPVVLESNPADVEAAVAAVCEDAGARLIRASDGVNASVEMREGRAVMDLVTPRGRYPSLTLGLRGRHQVANAITAIRLLEELPGSSGLVVPEPAIRSAVTDVVWPARLEVVHRRGLEVLIDGAHNPAGAAALATYVTETYGRRLPMVVGIMRDKDIDAMIARLAPSASMFFFTSVSSPRAARPADLVERASRVAPAVMATSVDDPLDAIARAAEFGSPVVVAGSLYLAGDVRAKWS